ncbi:hypothetical protein NN6n1_32930 [Shinella zoogloeoides]
MNEPTNNLQHDNRNRAGKNAPSKRRALATALLACTALLAAAPAEADENWTGANGTNWFDPGNWSTGVPGSSDTVFINPAGAARPVILSGGPAQPIAHMYVGFINNGDLTIRDGAILTNSGNGGVGYPGTDGIVTVTGQGSQWTTLGGVLVGAQGNGVLRILNGAKGSANYVIVGMVASSTLGEVLVD